MNDVEVCDSADECGEDIANHNELQFTGNWFIDAGILGFVNLMEDVYGWDLEKLQEMVKENPEVVYYWHFPIAFVYYNNKQRGKDIGPIPDPPKNFESKEDLFEAAWEWICSKDEFLDPKKEKRVDLSSKDRFYYFHNLLFFQPNWEAEKQKEAFMEILGIKDIEKEVLNHIDKTINKFLPSTDEFSNISYTQGFVTPQTLTNLNSHSFIFVLSFPLAFIRVILPRKRKPENILFYSSDLGFTYRVNKKLTKLIEKLENRSAIFQITWKAVIDSIVETQSIWTLENMYLVKYVLGKNQNILNAEYIGVPKLQASILLEDPIRESLNVKLQTDDNDWKWILEEFIKNKPLYLLILRHVQYCINENKMVNRKNQKTSLYALAINAKIKENNSIELFSSDFLKGYRSIVGDIKETYRNLSIQATNISKLFDSKEDRQKICYSLMAALKRRNRIAFTNILLKKFLEKSNLREISYLNRFIFDKVTMNDVSWENYALALVIGIWSFGGGESEESDLEE